MNPDVVKALIQAIEKNSTISKIDGTWVLLMPHYDVELPDDQFAVEAQRIINAIQQEYTWVTWADKEKLAVSKKIYIPNYEDKNCIGFLKIQQPRSGQEWRIRPVTHPLLLMNSIFRNLVISTKLYILYNNRKLNLDNLNDKVAIQNEKSQIEFWINTSNYGHIDIRNELWNIFLASISGSALAFDESLSLLSCYVEQYVDNKAFLEGKFIINQLRHAFAHGIRDPYWVIKKIQMDKFDRISFYLTEDGDPTTENPTSKNVIFDPRAVNHKSFELGDIGGSGAYICLLKFLLKEAQRLVNKCNADN